MFGRPGPRVSSLFTNVPLKPSSINYKPTTTYRRMAHKPLPYDNTIMLRDAPKHKRPTTISREFDSPSHFFQSEEREPAGRGRGMETGLPGYAAETLFRNAKSNATRVLYQSPITAFEPSIASFRSLNPSQFNFSATSSLPSQNTELIYRRRLQDSSASKVEISESERMQSRLRDLRPWEYTTLGKLVGDESDVHARSLVGGGTRFTILNYNILAQTYIETHRDLYSDCVKGSLGWSERFNLLLNQINEFTPDIICFQEVEETEYNQSFAPALNYYGYRGVFKKRTGDKPDGCAIFWNRDRFSLIGKLAVDLRQPHVPLLDRDNVALMVKLESRYGRNNQRLVVSTTHLLFNPKRTDVKLAQVQFLLAELDRFSFSGFGREGEILYLPTLLCGDFNTEPHSTIANLITDGSLRYLDANGLLPKALEKRGVVEFLPSYFGISDQCQHYRIQLERVKQWRTQRKDRLALDRKTELGLINIRSEDAPQTTAVSSAPSSDLSVTNEFTDFSEEQQERLLSEMRKFGISCSFGSGILSHDLKLRNVYGHKLDRKDAENYATTKQATWTCVDFIYQGMQWNGVERRREEGNLKLIKRLRLPTRNECKEVGQLPNLASPSDHYPLLAEFLLK